MLNPLGTPPSQSKTIHVQNYQSVLEVDVLDNKELTENNKSDEKDSNIGEKKIMARKTPLKKRTRKEQKAYFAKVKGHYKKIPSGITFVKPHYRKVKHPPIDKYKTYIVPSGSQITVSSSPTDFVEPVKIDFEKIFSDKYWTKPKKKKK